jgi:hypothetical protein
MGLFSRKEKIPEIPTAPTLPELPKLNSEEKKNLPELPSFPSNSKNENLNQEMVKSAIADNVSPEEKGADMNVQNDIHISEEPEEESMIPPRPSVEKSIPKLPSKPSIINAPKKTLEINQLERKSTKEIEPIFVRIDKFQSAQKNFEQIKNKIKEIESVIGKIKDIKSKEENELENWAEDIEKIKSRLSEVDSEIFNQI